ncbi:MAG: hypothetical protein D6811_07080 [Alphaproteobacteria bacterium]|nr:MAG: hypothetical protein D6811_07080 [Alphaproteobacteria bacterium]
MSILSRLFGGKGGSEAPASEPESYQGFAIYPEPMAEKEGFRVAARITLEIDGETREHRMIRADVCGTREAAVSLTLVKARQLIDQQGRRIFG